MRAYVKQEPTFGQLRWKVHYQSYDGPRYGWCYHSTEPQGFKESGMAVIWAENHLGNIGREVQEGFIL